MNSYVDSTIFAHMQHGLRGLVFYLTHKSQILNTAASDHHVIHNLRTTLRLAESERNEATTLLRSAEQNANAAVKELQASEKKRRHIVENLQLLAEGRYQEVYEAIKPDFDPDGWHLYFAAEQSTKIDISKTFSTEDTLGYFEGMDGNGLLPWLECAAYGHCDWKQLDCPGGYEVSENRTIDTQTVTYRRYREELFKEVVSELLLQ